MDRDDMIDIACDAMQDAHDMDTRLRDFAAAAVDALIREGAILGDVIADDLKRLGARACEIGLIGERDLGPSISLSPDHTDVWAVTMITSDIKVMRATGATPGAALAAFSALLDARSPAVGWATLGVEA